MFIIIGGDGREYGPATADQVRAWINGGRANLETRAKLAGENEWRRLGDFPEFGAPAEPPTIAAAAVDQTGAEVRPAAESAGVGARTGAALINAFIYFCSLLPGGLWLSRKLLESNPEIAQGGFPKLEDLDMTGLAEGVFWVYAGLFAVLLVQALLILFRGQNLGKLLTGVKVVHTRAEGSREKVRAMAREGLCSVIGSSMVPRRRASHPACGAVRQRILASPPDNTRQPNHKRVSTVKPHRPANASASSGKACGHQHMAAKTSKVSVASVNPPR